MAIVATAAAMPGAGQADHWPTVEHNGDDLVLYCGHSELAVYRTKEQRTTLMDTSTGHSIHHKARASHVGSAFSLIVGLGIPVVAIMVVLPILSGSKITIAGLPFIYFWLFLWFPLTTICLFLSWMISDRHHYENRSELEGADQ